MEMPGLGVFCENKYKKFTFLGHSVPGVFIEK